MNKATCKYLQLVKYILFGTISPFPTGSLHQKWVRTRLLSLKFESTTNVFGGYRKGRLA